MYVCVCVCVLVYLSVCVIVQNSRAVASPVRPALAPFGSFWASPSQGQATFIANDKKRKTRTQFLWFHFGRFLFAERFKLLTAAMPQFISFGFRSGIQKYLQDARTCLINRNLFQAKLMVTPFGHFSVSLTLSVTPTLFFRPFSVGDLALSFSFILFIVWWPWQVRGLIAAHLAFSFMVISRISCKRAVKPKGFMERAEYSSPMMPSIIINIHLARFAWKPTPT